MCMVLWQNSCQIQIKDSVHNQALEDNLFSKQLKYRYRLQSRLNPICERQITLTN